MNGNIIPRWNKYFFNPVELNLNDDQRDLLKEKFHKSVERGYMYIDKTLTTYYANLEMLEGIYPDYIIEDLARITTGWGFCTSMGLIPKHVDAQRVACITIPIYNDDNVPLEFFDYHDKQIIETLHYGYGTWIHRTKEDHQVSGKSSTLRVHLQGDVFAHNFDNLLYEYEEKLLFKPKQ